MAHSIDIEVDVNGEHIFIIDKRILSSYSNRVSKLSTKLTGYTKLKFNDFPGGAESFELITRFCYNNGSIHITPSNIFLLHCGCTFMEIPIMITQTELYLEGIHYLTWSEFVIGLKQCQILFSTMNTHPCFQEFLKTLLGNLSLPSSYPSSNSSSFRFSSSDTTPKSSRSETLLDCWKFDDLIFLEIDLFEKVIESMILLHFEHPRICSFIFHYQKSKFFLCSSRDEKCKLSETTINLLSSLNGSSFSCRELLDAYGTSLSLSMRTPERLKLEAFLGSRLDEFRIDDLLVRGKKKLVFDVDLTLRLIKVFLLERRVFGFFPHRAKKVGFLVDLFMIEVAVDPFLKPSKFIALGMALPDFSRESHDRIYHAIDLYLQVHRGFNEDQCTKIWSILDFNKVSTITSGLHLVRNTNFLPFLKQNKFKTLLFHDFVFHKFHQYVKNTTKSEKPGAKGVLHARRFTPKRSRIIEPCNVKSLPRLCH
ncbi:BTB/POZ domain-containing protein At3g22104 [Lactuca sativa]|uniref:BTB/POZ domain-containing protein At3g22104 n=1 Tax=Lactuca sativa TaxID=4236 RepID=UPI000CD9A73A|nr:BTB/POZ domain-containing protein At3g22104 [Lactuca sativa]